MSDDARDAAIEARIESLLQAMTVEEKAALTGGASMWHSVSIQRLGIPAFKMSDGPNGVRGDGQTPGANSLNLPVGSVLGASWNPELLRAVGDALGLEARDKDVQVVLGPTINLQRLPIAGRNFECYSEDPLLTAELAREFVLGLQAHGVAACPKHFVGNEYERERMSANSRIDETTLQEAYLAPFTAAVRDAGAWSVMSAYNRVNGEPMCSNGRLLRDLLKDGWGFDGAVISDWTGTYSGVPSARAGLDLEMPGPARHFGAPLAVAVASGELDEAVLDDQARRLLRLMARTGRLARPIDDVAAEQSVDRPATRELARRALAEGSVLLHNRGLLPLSQPSDARLRIALIGPNAREPRVQGGGSSVVRPRERSLPIDALRAEFGEANVVLAQGCDNERYLPVPDTSVFDNPWRVRFHAAGDLGGAAIREQSIKSPETFWFGAVRGVPFAFSARLDNSFVASAAGAWQFSLMNAGRARLFVDDVLLIDNWTAPARGDSYIGFGSAELRAQVELAAGQRVALRIDYERGQAAAGIAGVRFGMAPPVPQDSLPEAVDAARNADLAIIVVGLTPDWESEGFDRADIALPGRQIELIRAVAAVNPRTLVVINAGSAIDIEPFVTDVAAVLHVGLPGQAFGEALVDMLQGRREPSGRLAHSVPRELADAPGMASHPPRNGEVGYDEGLDIGYRGYHRSRRMPARPLGFGRSFGRFEYSDFALSHDGVSASDTLTARLRLTNVGARAGTEVVQLYATALDHSGEPRADRPIRALLGFAKLHLAAGESRVVEISLPPERFRQFVPAQGWQLASGPYRIEAGASATDLRLRAALLVR